MRGALKYSLGFAKGCNTTLYESVDQSFVTDGPADSQKLGVADSDRGVDNNYSAAQS